MAAAQRRGDRLRRWGRKMGQCAPFPSGEKSAGERFLWTGSYPQSEQAVLEGRLIHRANIFERNVSEEVLGGAIVKPPYGRNVSARSRTSRRTSSGVPEGSVCCVSMDPWKHRRPPYYAASAGGAISTARTCTGSRMLTPISICRGIQCATLPQEWCMMSLPCFRPTL